MASTVSNSIPAQVELGGVATYANQSARSRWWHELLVIVWLGWVYDAITNLAPLRMHSALSHSRDILDLERSLHLDPELTLNKWLASHHALGLVVSDYYDNAHFVVTLGLLGWLWYRRADIYRPLRNALVITNLIGFAVFWRYPVAPPRLLAGAGFSDVVASTHAFGSWHTGSLASAANQLAAMPSLHIAWAVWCTVALWRMSSRHWVRALAVLYPCLTCLAVLSTGNHYLMDALAGLLTCGVSICLADFFVGSTAAGLKTRISRRSQISPGAVDTPAAPIESLETVS